MGANAIFFECAYLVLQLKNLYSYSIPVGSRLSRPVPGATPPSPPVIWVPLSTSVGLSIRLPFFLPWPGTSFLYARRFPGLHASASSFFLPLYPSTEFT